MKRGPFGGALKRKYSLKMGMQFMSKEMPYTIIKILDILLTKISIKK